MPVLDELSKERILDLYLHAVKRDAALIRELQLENLRLKSELDRLQWRVTPTHFQWPQCGTRGCTS